MILCLNANFMFCIWAHWLTSAKTGCFNTYSKIQNLHCLSIQWSLPVCQFPLREYTLCIKFRTLFFLYSVHILWIVVLCLEYCECFKTVLYHVKWRRKSWHMLSHTTYKSYEKCHSICYICSYCDLPGYDEQIHKSFSGESRLAITAYSSSLKFSAVLSKILKNMQILWMLLFRRFH